jgi:hypothetical protein
MEQTDRELLELAAKAMGYLVTRSGHNSFDIERPDASDWIGSWNPLTDDGDALRLAVKLNMRVRVQKFGYSVADNSASHGQKAERHESDPYAATRRAIVRAAAAIGKV